MWLFADMYYTIYIKGEAVPVTEEVYRTYYKEKRREKTLTEKDARNGASSFAEMDLLTADNPSAEQLIIAREMHERLCAALAALGEDEHLMICALYVERLGVAELSRRLGVPRKTLEFRRNKVLAKLREMMED